MSKSIDEFKKNPSLKILYASYDKSFTKKFSYLKNKEKLREKIYSLLSEMYNDNVILISLDDIEVFGNETDDEGEEKKKRTDYSSKK